MKLNQKNEGFISIIALGIFAFLIAYGIMLQINVMDTYNRIIGRNNYLTARSIADGVTEFLQFELNEHESGFNSGKIVCKYGTSEGGGNPGLCQEFDYLDTYYPNQEIEIKLEVKGRSVDGEEIKSAKITDAPYVVPFPGTGDAGENCDAYEPFDKAGTTKVPYELVGMTLDHADYSCNWNKLTFGSSLNDRVAIPLYYDKSQLTTSSVAGTPDIVNPFKDGDATKFYLRIRTPCENGKPDCKDTERYELDDETSDEIVVQWQLNGQCTVGGKEEECGMIAIPEDEDKLSVSAVFESLVNEPLSGKNILLLNKSQGLDITTNEETRTTIITKNPLMADPKLPLMSKPILALFLSNSLISKDDQKNIPYLEYQVLTDFPVGNSKLMMKITVKVDGNVFIKTLTKEVSKPLIDFAIQN